MWSHKWQYRRCLSVVAFSHLCRVFAFPLSPPGQDAFIVSVCIAIAIIFLLFFSLVLFLAKLFIAIYLDTLHGHSSSCSLCSFILLFFLLFPRACIFVCMTPYQPGALILSLYFIVIYSNCEISNPSINLSNIMKQFKDAILYMRMSMCLCVRLMLYMYINWAIC
jgi:hypothetical protein